MNIYYLKEQYLKMGKNFMTPDVERYVITSDNRVVEIATGLDMEGAKIWGVSEFEMIDGKLQTTKRGQMFRSLKEARAHFNLLTL